MTGGDQPGWMVYRIPIILGCTSVLLVLIAITIFIKSYQTTTPILFSSDSFGDTHEATQSGRKNNMFVDIEGAVRNPGVYSLPCDSRVEDAIQKAGGFAHNADIQAVSRGVNRAAKLSDGAKLYVPIIGERDAVTGTTQEVPGTYAQMNINTASQSELETLVDVGPVTAQKIIQNRPYLRLEELVEKKVMSQNLFEKLKEQLTL